MFLLRRVFKFLFYGIMDILFLFFLYVFFYFKIERNRKMMVCLGKLRFLWENRKSKLVCKVIELKIEGEERVIF